MSTLEDSVRGPPISKSKDTVSIKKSWNHLEEKEKKRVNINEGKKREKKEKVLFIIVITCF